MNLENVHILNLKDFLDEKVRQYNTPAFIANDPICIPHSFSRRQDIEIMGFFASIFAWGQRKTIINKCRELSARMDNSPYDFIINHKETDLKKVLEFKHRTFNDTDLLYCIDFMKRHFSKYETLEDAFFPNKGMSVAEGLNYFRSYFFSSPDAPHRTRKHISSSDQKSACKRLNMYLRWMVRNDNKGVDFGLWKKIEPKDLICPLDVHVERTAKKLNLMEEDKANWKAAVKLTESLKILDKNDPVKYDFALFGVSIEEKCKIDGNTDE